MDIWENEKKRFFLGSECKRRKKFFWKEEFSNNLQKKAVHATTACEVSSERDCVNVGACVRGVHIYVVGSVREDAYRKGNMG